MKSLIVVMATILSGYFVHANAWEYSEHVDIGESSYLHACSRLNAAFGGVEDEEYKAALEIACGDSDLLARRYGQATAIFGDHIGSSDEYIKELDVALSNAESFINYASLALKNSSHFFPSAPRTWSSNKWGQSKINSRFVKLTLTPIILERILIKYLT